MRTNIRPAGPGKSAGVAAALLSPAAARRVGSCRQQSRMKARNLWPLVGLASFRRPPTRQVSESLAGAPLESHSTQGVRFL